MQAAGSIGATSTIDTTGVSLPSIFNTTAQAVSGAANTVTAPAKRDNLMLWLTGAGVLLAALALFKRKG